MTECAHNHTSAGDAQAHRDEPVSSARRLLAAFVVITIFMVVEVVGGIISGSLALLADAAHMLTDAMALGLAVSAQFIALRPADERRHFGYHRARVLAAFVNGILLMFLLAWIAIEAIHRFTAPFDVNAKVMFSVAVAGLAANAIA
ncbi:MAG: cation transporter, partial [Amphiplicatus sp.]|nr:cation transporter [Amphiplicatus sp.]